MTVTQLTAAGFAVEVKNRGEHVIVSHAGHVVDYWPSTGRWLARGGKHTRRGVESLVDYLRRARPVEPRPAASGAWSPDVLARWVTVHADAGFKAGFGRVAFAARASIEPLHLRWKGDIGTCRDVQEAEAVALLYGVRAALWTWHHAIEGGILGFFLRSDNLAVVNALAGRGGTPKHARAAVDEIRGLSNQLGFGLHVKHVPGHSASNTKAAYMNNLCDAGSNLRGRRV